MQSLKIKGLFKISLTIEKIKKNKKKKPKNLEITITVGGGAFQSMS